jgi:hypothetical protein
VSAAAIRKGVVAAALLTAFLSGGPGDASAAPPQILSTRVLEGSVTANTVGLKATVNPGGVATTYAFEYISEAAYEANLEATPPREAFAGAAMAPPSGAGPAGAGSAPTVLLQELQGLAPATA